MAPTPPRRGRINPVAAVASLLCGIVAALALWGMQRSPVPAAADFGSASPATPSAAPDAAADVAAAASAGEGDGGSRVVIEQPGTRSASLTDAAPADRLTPERLLVPSLDLDVPLDAVGVADDGQMEIPEDADRAGWYRFGPAPGDDSGSAVVAGHVDDRSGPGAFLALTEVEEGAELTVQLSDGTEVAYRVTAREQVAKPELPLDDVFTREGPPHLRLITCTGDWSQRNASYTDNLVITAEPVEG